MSANLATEQASKSHAEVRAWFPSLQTDFAFLENAGGSQLPGVVIGAMQEYMRDSYVQVGAGYPQSDRATGTVHNAHAFVELLMGASGKGKVVLGPSTTALLHILSNAYGEIWSPGDQVVIAETNHEANAGPWERLTRFGIEVRIWKVDPLEIELSLDSLADLLGPRTRMVAFPHVSNLLGDVVDVKRITELVHHAGAKVCVDGVAFAPHRPMDVADWGVDWYVYSAYKVYGPHIAALYGRNDAFEEITGPSHFFFPKEDVIHKFELGSLSHEACAGVLALQPYLQWLSGNGAEDRDAIVKAFQVMQSLEEPLKTRLIDYLRGKQGVRLIRTKEKNADSVGTVSFVHKKTSSSEVVEHVHRRGIGIRYGHMYAVRLCHALGIDLATGVVRVSLVHYNTPEEIDRLIRALDEVL